MPDQIEFRIGQYALADQGLPTAARTATTSSASESRSRSCGSNRDQQDQTGPQRCHRRVALAVAQPPVNRWPLTLSTSTTTSGFSESATA